VDSLAVSLADIEAAAATISDDVVLTPSHRSATLSQIAGADVIIKFENHQFTGSFKDRGAANRLRTLPRELAERGVVAVSAGNHAQGVAYMAGRLGITATIVMPTNAPYSKVAHTADHGAHVLQEGQTLAEASDYARRLADDQQLTWVHPYDDPAVIAGQGTVGLELLAAHEDLDAIVVPIGGGGLIAGIATVVKAKRPAVEIIGVQSETYPSMIDALAGRTFSGSRVDTLADGIAVKTPGELTVPIVEALVDDVLVVPEALIEDAIHYYIEIEKTVAEGAGAASLAALLAEPDRFAGRRVAIILSGGNIDTRLLASVLMRGLVHSGRLTSLRIPVDDLPGRLAGITALVGAAGANIIEVEHRRLFDPVSARSTGINLIVETRDRRHADELLEQIREAGYDVERQT
jgi:threonine dehydratase